MAVRLPPLNALRAFESAGRNQSFAKAAAELHVTPGAVSRQISALEQSLGCQLFRRFHREVRLTSEASAYLESISNAFRQIERATHRISDARKQRLLHIHAAITFTLRWLVPRLARFHARHPRTEIRLSASLPSSADMHASPTDVTIRIGTAESTADAAPQVVSHRLVDIDLSPVCTPAYARTHGLVPGAGARLADCTLLHSAARPKDWQSWLGAADLADADIQHGIDFESSSLAYQGALEGMGVAIAMRAFVEADLAAGRLVEPFDFVARDGSAFYLSYSKAAASLPQVQEFRDWITAEV